MLLTTGLIGGCDTEPIKPGWFTPPTQKPVVLDPADLGLDYEPLEILAPAGHTLNGWFIAADGAPATVLIHHGSIFNRGAFFPQYSLIHSLGYNVVIYDYQGFGDSPGEASLATLIPDADAVLAHVQERPELAGGRIVLFGLSLGTLPTLAQAARAPAGVAGVMLDGSFTLDSLPASSYAAIGVVPLPQITDDLYVEYPQLDATRYIGRITLPKLFIHSPQDATTPLAGAQRLFDLAPEPKQWCEVYGGHALSCVLDPGYEECIAAFLDEIAP